MAQKISKDRVFLIKFWHYIRVKATYIHFLHCVNSKNTCVRYNLASYIQWHTLFINSSKYNFQMFSNACGSSKIVLQAIDEQSISLDILRRKMYDKNRRDPTHFRCIPLEKGPKNFRPEYCFHLRCFHAEYGDFFALFLEDPAGYGGRNLRPGKSILFYIYNVSNTKARKIKSYDCK